MKKRLDMLMMDRALAPSREKAKAYIMAGDVYVDGQKEDKAGTMFPETVKIEVRGNTLPYVSRGGLKLEKAMKNFDVTLEGKVCMDVGASTGGFTDCMLQNGAVKVYSIDVGYGQLDWKLRNDPRVVCMEKTNIRYVLPENLEGPADFSSIDVSFISLTQISISLSVSKSTEKVVLYLIFSQSSLNSGLKNLCLFKSTLTLSSAFLIFKFPDNFFNTLITCGLISLNSSGNSNVSSFKATFNSLVTFPLASMYDSFLR